MPIAMETLKKYKDRANVFVETGTHIGITTRMAVELNYEKIYTIELAKHFYERAVRVPKLLKEITEPCLFWLDGHWSDGDTALGPVPVPLYQELEAIAEHGIKTHTILIDDTRLMGKEWKDVELLRVKELLFEINKDYKLSFEDGYLDPRTKTKVFNKDILVAQL